MNPHLLGYVLEIPSHIICLHRVSKNSKIIIRRRRIKSQEIKQLVLLIMI